jgi:hypothetical protein
MVQAGRPNLQRFLDRLNSRSILTAEEQDAILNLPGQAEQVHANRDFVALGERVDHSCLMVAGIVGRFDQTSEGVKACAPTDWSNGTSASSACRG